MHPTPLDPRPRAGGRRPSRDLAAVLIAGLLLAAGCSRPRPGVPPTNLLLITFEAVRADHCSALQYPRPTTFVEVVGDEPRAHDLDLIAETGVTFAHAFAPSAAPWVSLAALHTGRARTDLALVDGVGLLEAASATLAERLRASGFDTAAFTLTSVPIGDTGLERGFAVLEEHRTPIDLLRGVAAWLYEVRDEDRPHFLWLHLGEAAWPWTWDPLPGSRGRLDFRRLFADPERDAPLDLEPGLLEALARGERSLSVAERRAFVAAYDGQVARANVLMREFLEYYKHLWSDTLVVVAGANGMELGERGHYGSQGSLHDGGLRVPLLLRHPGSLTGRRILAEVVELADVVPTVLEWFAEDVPDELGGRSLLPLVDSYVRRSFDSRPAIAWRADGARALRDERWRLVLKPADGPTPPGWPAVGAVELYDLHRDPRALRDVAASYPAVVDALRAVLGGDGRP